MKNFAKAIDKELALRSGILDSRTHPGEAGRNDYRILLNTSTGDERGRARMGGWSAWRSDEYSNEDLHDQLLPETGAQQEAVNVIVEATASTKVNYLLAATSSRIYASTGSSRNWRIIADELGPTFSSGQSPWLNVKTQFAQLGDYMLFSNGVNNVMAWQLGAKTITEGENAAREWAAFEVYDLLGLKIIRAGCISAWGGFAFIGDVTVDNEQISSRVYWSDYNRPLEWAPGGESSAGYVDFGRGERVVCISPIGGGLRCYTDKAIYAVELVGGDAVFLFREIYRGDLAIAFRESFVNLGDTHCWLTNDSIVVLGEYDKAPREVEWMRKATGFIFNGLDERLLKDCPVEFSGFLPLDRAKCHQIATGYDGKLGNLWISWPTQRTSEETPDDELDFDGVKRMTLVMSTRYQKATLVDHGFSAFGQARINSWKSVYDWLLDNGVDDCSESPMDVREGAPLNNNEAVGDPPPYIWNETEDPELPMEDDSLAAAACELNLSTYCSDCLSEVQFCMASARDFSLKKFTPDTCNREMVIGSGLVDNAGYIPEDVPGFPNVVPGEYELQGYPTLIQSECSQHGVNEEKVARRIGVEFDADVQTIPGNLNVQLGISNSPHCIDWFDASTVALDCNRGSVSDETKAGVARPTRPASFAFYRTGSWVAYRIFLSDADGETYSPTGCGVSFSSVVLNMNQKNETWTNQ